jgi:RNA polymerase sigma-70 factor (ECF subfamily)
MSKEPTTDAIQRYLNALPADTSAEPLIRELLDRAVCRLRTLSAAMLYRKYPRLALPPLNLEADELLGGVVAGLLTALRTVRPRTVRQFFALATQHMRWQLNDLARRLDNQPAAGALAEGSVAAPSSSSGSGLTPDTRRMLEAIEDLPGDEREVFDLIRIQGLTYAEAAALIETSIATVQRRLSRARLRLAQQLADLLPGPSGGAPEPPGDDRSPKPGPPCRRLPSGEILGPPGDTLPP